MHEKEFSPPGTDRAYRFWKNLDGQGKKCYDGATEITYADMRFLDATIIILISSEQYGIKEYSEFISCNINIFFS